MHDKLKLLIMMQEENVALSEMGTLRNRNTHQTQQRAKVLLYCRLLWSHPTKKNLLLY